MRTVISGRNGEEWIWGRTRWGVDLEGRTGKDDVRDKGRLGREITWGEKWEGRRLEGARTGMGEDRGGKGLGEGQVMESGLEIEDLEGR